MAFLLQLLYLCFVVFDVYYGCVGLVSPCLLFIVSMDLVVSSDSDVLAVFCGVFVTTAGDVGCSLLRPTGLDPPPLASSKSAESEGEERRGVFLLPPEEKDR